VPPPAAAALLICANSVPGFLPHPLLLQGAVPDTSRQLRDPHALKGACWRCGGRGAAGAGSWAAVQHSHACHTRPCNFRCSCSWYSPKGSALPPPRRASLAAAWHGLGSECGFGRQPTSADSHTRFSLLPPASPAVQRDRRQHSLLNTAWGTPSLGAMVDIDKGRFQRRLKQLYDGWRVRAALPHDQFSAASARVAHPCCAVCRRRAGFGAMPAPWRWPWGP
jgi:hypothetical protein